MRYVVYHGDYGCDTGCCGHYVEQRDDDDKVIDSNFEFDHPYRPLTEDNIKEYVRDLITAQFGAEHCADIDWDECYVYDY